MSRPERRATRSAGGPTITSLFGLDDKPRTSDDGAPTSAPEQAAASNDAWDEPYALGYGGGGSRSKKKQRPSEDAASAPHVAAPPLPSSAAQLTAQEHHPAAPSAGAAVVERTRATWTSVTNMVVEQYEDQPGLIGVVTAPDVLDKTKKALFVIAWPKRADGNQDGPWRKSVQELNQLVASGGITKLKIGNTWVDARTDQHTKAPA